ncbi:ABC transporter ATP-binding protein [Methanocalculus sp.]|uniref:ABC transporter ATP-binding protein n=1 Tax=Methanocalculus sp. TaxID=2004547 RepID=UPI0027172872|nr:ABC transporter ATP-binding protein [Methanocalculus sp.]MDO8842373.1 ABC transporter ATP-binding protein [Methanocalculus sp.]
MIELTDLTKRYNGVAAVDSLSLSIGEGEIIGLLGPNGAGKSTTILMTTGLIEPDGGEIRIAGYEMQKEPKRAKALIGYMPEDVGFYPRLTAAENLDFFGKLYEMEREKRKRRIDDLLVLVGLDGVQTQVGGYSKGMRQRLGLAKALLNEPPVIILDEPTANLDPVGVSDYRRIVREAAAAGSTILVSSHILAEVSVICTRIALLSRGKLVADGTWQEIADHGKGVVIRVEGRRPLPEFPIQGISSVIYTPDRVGAVIAADHDIRDAISDLVASAGVPLRNLQIDSESAEEALLQRFREEARS